MNKSVLAGAVLVVGFVGCSEAGDPTGAPQLRFDEVCTTACYDSRIAVTAYPGTINLSNTLALGFVVDGRTLDANAVRKSTMFRLTSYDSGDSDTIPAPLPPGPVEHLLRTVEGRAFIKGIFAMADDDGGPAPSDTIPGPGPQPNHTMVWDFNADGINDLLVLASAKYLKDSKRLRSSTVGFRLTVDNGKTSVSSGFLGVAVLSDIYSDR